MKASSVALLLDLAVLLVSGLAVSAISLNVSPNRQQFFSGESVRLSCEKHGNSAGWTLKRISFIRTETCEADEGFGTLNGSTCIISDLSLSSGQGVYWCEHHSGQRSTTITITVSERPFIMEIPALPVMAGSDVTLRCRDRHGSTVPVNFFKFGRHTAPFKAAPNGEFTIRNVQQSDEGYYWCSTDQTTSPSSKLSVRAASLPPTNSSAPLSASPLVKLLCHLVAISPYCVSTGLMVSICCCRKTGSNRAWNSELQQNSPPTLTSGTVTMEMVNEHADDITTVHNF
ncbi:roundabout homolog 2-like [Acanthopagrus schlegelii]